MPGPTFHNLGRKLNFFLAQKFFFFFTLLWAGLGQVCCHVGWNGHRPEKFGLCKLLICASPLPKHTRTLKFEYGIEHIIKKSSDKYRHKNVILNKIYLNENIYMHVHTYKEFKYLSVTSSLNCLNDMNTETTFFHLSVFIKIGSKIAAYISLNFLFIERYFPGCIIGFVSNWYLN